MRQASLKKMQNWPGNWDAPVWGPVLQSHVPWNEEVNKIITAVDEHIKKGDDAEKCRSLVVEMFDEAFDRFRARQPIVLKQIQDFEAEMNRKLTSDHLVTGFDKTTVSKANTETTLAPPAEKTTSKTIETIHTPSDKKPEADEFMMGIFEEMECRDEDLNALNPALLLFSQKSDYGDLVKLLRQHPKLQSEKAEEVLLLRAICMATVGDLKAARNCVQNSLVLKYTRNLQTTGNGIEMFFGKLQGAGSSAQNLFFGDVNTTYEHITKRGATLRKERLEKKAAMEEQERKKKEIYNSFLQPDGTLKLPLGPEPSEVDLKQKEWFDQLPEDYKQGLLLEDVDKINAYLSSLPPEEASFQANLAAKSGFIQFQDEDEDEAAE
ncbi:hsp90 co-chaperone Cdc37 [Kappamyces sp. JEL0829]|nr:hsp90 co-chaperone Cdc37 [Kappamyces sp. JEL0829]